MCKLVCKVIFGSLTATFLFLASFVLYVYYIDTNVEFDSHPWKSLDVKLPSSKNNLKVAFLVYGTRGDFQPIALIAKEFKENGHTIIITARERYRYLMTDILEFTEEEILWFPEDEDTFLEKLVGDPMRRANLFEQAYLCYTLLNREIDKLLHIIFNDERFDDIDLVVTQEYIIPAGVILSLKRKVPLMVLKFSIFVTSTNEYSILSPKSAISTSSIFNWLEFQVFNMAAYYYQHTFFKNTLAFHNLPRMSLANLYYGKFRYQLPSYFLVSKAIYPELARTPKWWNFFGPVFNKEKIIPPETKAFLEKCKNETVVYVGFGSFSLEEYYGNDTEYTKRVLFNTISRLNFCAIFLNASFKIPPQSELAKNPKFHIPNHVPHTLVFPKVNLIIHHGGAGTNQVAAASGTISIAIPIFEEQSINTRFAVSYGTSLILESTKLSEEILESTINEALKVKDLKEKSQRVRDSSLGTKFIYDDMLSWL